MQAVTVRRDAYARGVRRTRRPLIALIVLAAILALGYGLKACDSTSARTHGTSSVRR